MTDASPIACDVCVVGSGMAGMSAALFAVNRGLATVLVGRTGEIIFASGLLDLMGVHPVEQGLVWDDPWAGMARLVQDLPRHPFAWVPVPSIRSAFAELIEFLNAHGLVYTGYPERNARVLSAVGTLKLSFRVPLTMWHGVEAGRSRTSCLLVDFRGLKGFSARQIAAVAGGSWLGLRAERIAFPGLPASGEIFPERLARALEVPKNRELLAAAIRPRLGGAESVGLPAVLGVAGSAEVMHDLESRLGVSVFEIPTMPPGVPGLRLKETFERGLNFRGVALFLENKAFRAEVEESGRFLLAIGRSQAERVIRAGSVILATGRFMGGGLRADRSSVRETLFNLPVHQPAHRSQWHCDEFLDRRGHPINRAGLEIDECQRPLNAAGRAAHPFLFAAGSILAHQDWMRMKCGSGLAIATAYGAVDNLLRLQRGQVDRSPRV